MEIRAAASPKDVKHYTTERLREEFLIPTVFEKDGIKLVYSHIDRIITGGAMPVSETLHLTAGGELRAEYFLERREMGVINIGGEGIVTVDGREYQVASRDGMYLGMGAKDISFASRDAGNPAKFYLNSTPAHKAYPRCRRTAAEPVPYRPVTYGEGGAREDVHAGYHYNYCPVAY